VGRIQVLDDRLVNRIAAGEVVERPASVVKELIENSLDASARRIDITAIGAGKRVIRVEDDGHGMDRDDALLALERHATSKLRSPEDLERIATLGFRGEAIPSIAAVSRFVLRTAPEGGIGTEIEVRGGRILAVREVGLPRGTTIEASSLFFNTPARRKFLKSEATELAHIVRVVTRHGLGRPDVGFRLAHDGRDVLDLPAASDLGERVEQIFGADLRRTLLPVAAERDGVRLRGFVGRPADASSRRDAQHFFVNGRLVQDRVLSHAVVQAYGNTAPRDRLPSIFLLLEIAPSLVDVNVHPQKNEVRFARVGEIHDATRDAIVASLGGRGAIPGYTELRPRGELGRLAGAAAGPLQVKERPPTGGGYAPADPEADSSARVVDRVGPPAPAASGPAPAFFGAAESDPRESPRAVPLAQYEDSYIVAQDEGGLLVVDQHAAHERILFEQYLAQAEENRIEVQRLLFPVVLELAPQERVLLEEEAGEFARLGFSLEPFGDGAVRLEGVPALASGVDPRDLVRAILGEARRTRAAAAGIGELRRKLVTTTACHAAIKINHRLSVESMQRLLDDLFRTSNPTTCPHGRPVLFRMTREEIERTFRRR